MAAASDRALFLEMVKTKAMTVKEIVEMFGVAAGTARTWTQHESIETVEGSWPPAFTRRDNLIPVNPVRVPKSTPKTGKVIVEFDKPPTEEIEAFFHRVMANEGGKLDFDKEFRAINSQQDLLVLISKIKACYVVCEYYKALMVKEEMP